MGRTKPHSGQYKPGIGPQSSHSRHSPWPKPYSDAAREFLSMPHGQVKPDSWPEERAQWTVAQVMVERHATIALAGSMDMVEWLVERAEGKTPMAPEDRKALKDAKSAMPLGGLSALLALKMALGLVSRDAVDVDVIDTPALPPGKET